MSWTLTPACPPATAQVFTNLDAVFEARGEFIARDPLSEVIRVDIGGLRYYVKRYQGAGKNPLRQWFARSRVRAEWENLLTFRSWGIPTAAVIGYGLQMRFGAFRRGALITAEVPHAESLAHLASQQDARLRDRRWVAHVSKQVAAATRCLHAHGFAHNDLKWRNLLVDDAARVYLIDCPSGRFWFGPFLRYRIVKDLACLDKVAKYRLTRSQRLRFYLDYTGKTRLDAAGKQQIRRILRFFAGRE